MHLCQNTAELQDIIAEERRNGRSLGFVPTMGALHEGHLSLIRRSQERGLRTFCSIFVNPTQFNDPEDFRRYPRDPEKDLKMLEKAGCHYVLLPTLNEIYPDESFKNISFSPGKLGEVFEGAHRPGHFQGMAAVVKRLFDLFQPDVAFFGQKDYQQWLIINKMVTDLRLPTGLEMVPTMREPDGLAMSSRNALLSPEERRQALFLHEMLQKGASLLREGSSPEQAKEQVLEAFRENGNFAVDYFDICSAIDLQPVSGFEAGKPLILLTAAKLGNVRLIDNVLTE